MKNTSNKNHLQSVIPDVSKYFSNQRIPWVSLSLLFIGYTIQGYSLTQEHLPLLIYLIIVLSYAVLQLAIFNSGVQQIGNNVMQWIVSDAIHLIVILVIVFLISFILSYLKLFEDLLLVLAAEILVRFDLQQRGLSQVQKSTVLTLCLTLGLTMGWLIDTLVV